MGLGTAIVRWCATAGVSSLRYIYVQNQLPHGVLAVFREYGSLTHNNIRHLKGSESSRTSKKYLHGRLSFMFVITVKMQGIFGAQGAQQRSRTLPRRRKGKIIHTKIIARQLRGVIGAHRQLRSSAHHCSTQAHLPPTCLSRPLIVKQ